jgi:hypothetical protein
MSSLKLVTSSLRLDLVLEQPTNEGCRLGDEKRRFVDIVNDRLSVTRWTFDITWTRNQQSDVTEKTYVSVSVQWETRRYNWEIYMTLGGDWYRLSRSVLRSVMIPKRYTTTDYVSYLSNLKTHFFIIKKDLTKSDSPLPIVISIILAFLYVSKCEPVFKEYTPPGVKWDMDEQKNKRRNLSLKVWSTSSRTVCTRKTRSQRLSFYPQCGISTMMKSLIHYREDPAKNRKSTNNGRVSSNC